MASQRKYTKPPINEVVCGLRFEAVPGLDPLTIGVYAKERESEFPKHELHPALGVAPVIVPGEGMPIRAWLISEDEAFVIQLQADRFYLNWRARGSKYPTFSGYEGSPGILPRMTEEFDRFGAFCKKMFGQTPKVIGIELAKIDHFPEGEYWRELDDLGELIPLMLTMPKFSRSDKAMIGMRFVEPRDGGNLSVSLDLGTIQESGALTRFVKLESRIEREVRGDLEAIKGAFSGANQELNEVFDALISESEALRRFNK